jgi:hypothetical protein
MEQLAYLLLLLFINDLQNPIFNIIYTHIYTAQNTHTHKCTPCQQTAALHITPTAFVLQGRAMGRKEHVTTTHKLIIQAVTAGHGKNATLNKNAHW